MILLLLPAIALLIWSGLPDTARDWLFLPVWAVSSWLILAGSLESARLRRRVWLDQYLQPGSTWHRLLRGGWPLLVWHLLIASMLALFMLARLLHVSGWLWLLLLAQTALIWWLARWLGRRLGAHVKTEVRPALTRRLLVPLSMVPLLSCYVLVALQLPQPDMVAMGWAEAVDRYLPGSHSGMGLLALCERVYLLLDLTLQWAMQNALGSQDDSGALAILGWSLLLLAGTAFTWAWVRMLAGVGTLSERGEGG